MECVLCGNHPDEQQQLNALLAVCDVLVYKAMEDIGKWVVRADRSRFSKLGNRPYHVAHTLWQPTDSIVEKALRGAWDVVPALMNVYGMDGVHQQELTAMLDSYVHDLAITGTEHTLEELVYRFDSRMGLGHD